jgi:hypothetical protein
MMNLARTFTRFPVSIVKEDSPIVLELAQLVFPNKVAGRLSPNDRSDIRHLVTAIENNLVGLVTNDEAILAAARAIGRKFGVLELTRFRRHPNVSFGGVFDGYQECPVYAGV